MFISICHRNEEAESGAQIDAKLYGKLVLEGQKAEDVGLSNKERVRLKIP